MEPAFLFIGSEFDITCVFINIKDLYSGDMNGYIIKWNFETRRLNIKHKAHSKSVLNIDFLHTKNQIISHGRDGYLKFWSILDNKFYEVNRMESNQFTFCKFSIFHSIDREIICNSLNDNDHTLEIIEFPNNVITHHICAKPQLGSVGNFGMVMCISMVNAKLLIVGFESGFVLLFNNFKQASSLKVSTCVICLCVSSEGKIIIGTPESELIVLQVINDWNELTEIKKIQLINPGISSIVFRKDYKLFATAGWDGLIRVFSSKSYKQLVVLKWNINFNYLDRNSLSLTFNDDNYLISGSDDKLICFWNVYRDK